jgi:hypothetical protein
MADAVGPRRLTSGNSPNAHVDHEGPVTEHPGHGGFAGEGHQHRRWRNSPGSHAVPDVARPGGCSGLCEQRLNRGRHVRDAQCPGKHGHALRVALLQEGRDRREHGRPGLRVR